ncbi:type-F conjugative transfer system protein TrbI [Scandinavium goeteborgense]|uniref:Conjugal transfer pilin signal peptidase TrbI n=1 Tax=Scandinavium goeteborgense TaxID=1851514 RepID=A0A4R6E2F8_SCAGO|nr:type-F conjugative transfer system protein TrbI [Scandinavium goeteborgense]TDN51494.1 conjugal transfer pilin signal peptidase TrbI [Scandinavium goeteborgense]
MTDVSTTQDVQRVDEKQKRTSHQPLTSRQRRQRRCLRSLLLVACCILCINAGITSLLLYWKTPETVTFDMKGTLDRFTAQLDSQALSEDQIKTLTARFTTALDHALKNWQQSHDALILVQPAVVSGAKDITSDIQADIADRMLPGPSSMPVSAYISKPAEH